MFCYQRSFGRPTEVVTAERFWALVRAPQTSELIDGYRETGDAALKRKLPAFIFQATFEETVSKKGNKGAWRCQAGSQLNGLCVMDVDHVGEQAYPQPLPVMEGSDQKSNMHLPPRELFEKWKNEHSELFSSPLQGDGRGSILLVYVTPSGHGLKIVFKADAAKGNLIDNQHAMAKVLGVEVDESCKDASRMSFICKESDILYLDNELFTYENKEYGKKYNEQYHHGKSQPTLDFAEDSTGGPHLAPVEGAGENQQAVSGNDGGNQRIAESMTYNGVSYAKIIEAWMEGRNLTNKRHDTLVELSDHLRYLIGKNPTKITEVVMALPWVQDLAAEGEDVAGTVSSIMGWRYKQKRPDEIVKALEKVGAASPPTPPQIGRGASNAAGSPLPLEGLGEAFLPFETWASELQEMSQYYPCLKELFLNVHPYKLAAVWFSSAALFGTLMTRAWYHFWYEPETVRRLNYCIFIIGDPGAGKNIVEKFYKKIADPMIQADKCLIEAVNRYKEGRTERTTSTKAQKGEALKRPVVGIRVHPARTSTGEFIRHMNAAIETIQGQPLNLHMFSFDAELDNVTKQNKGGDWKDREIMELKAFHNEEEGQMYANQESYTGMFNIYWNFIYTGTPYALHRKVNQRNFGTGMSTRLAVIPLPDKGSAQRRQQVDPNANETLRTWAYRLDKVEGELPIEPLNDETYEWQSSHLEIAEFNGDKADRTLLKRIPYYGIGISLPFILMRHWDEWQESKTLTMDDRDKRLCRLAMEIQYKCQQFFFGEMAFNYFADQNKEFVQRRRTTRYDDCFRKLPDEFKTQQFMDCFGCSQPSASRGIQRLMADGVVERVQHGRYRKLLQELP